MVNIGVYICHCGVNIRTTVDVEGVAKFAGQLDNVVIARDYAYMCSDPGQALIKKDIDEFGLNRVVVVACSPLMHQSTFRRVVESVGLNPYLFEMANIREQCSWVHKDKEMATKKAMTIVASSIARASLLNPLEEKEVDVIPSALVVGGGIAGIQSSLDIANAGFDVHLVEKEPLIGGRMAQLDKTFPTLDCSACILTPKMTEVGEHPNIELHTYAEVMDVEGCIGNFKVKIKKKSTYVDWSKCNGCGECEPACPVSVWSEFDALISKRKAIYRPFPQAVPNKFTIEKKGIPPCRMACPAGVNVQGYISLISQGKFKEALALEREANPFPSVCGRVCTHPCEDECKRVEYDEPIAIRSLKRFIADYEKEKEEVELPPKRKERVAIIGSGPAGLSCAYWLARGGYNVTVFESLPVIGGMLYAGIPDFRLPKKMLKRDVDYILDYGVEVKTNQKLVRDFTFSDLYNRGYSAILLATGAHKERRLNIPGEDLKGVLYCIQFLQDVNLKRDVEIGKRVVVVGGGNAAFDAARTALRLGAEDVTIVYRRSRAELPANDEEVIAAEEEGIKIKYLAAPTRILGGDGKVIGMECVRMELGEVDDTGRRRPIPVEGSEFQIDVDTIIPTISQSPDLEFLHAETGLEKTRWDTLVVDPVTLETTIPGTFAAGDVVSGAATVIEAIAGGKEASVSIDRYLKGLDMRKGRKSELKPVEEFPIPEKRKKKVNTHSLPVEERVKSFKEVDFGYNLEHAIEEADRCLNCGVCSECGECKKVCEPEAIIYEQKEEIMEVDVGTIVVATGFDSFDASLKPEFGYGLYDNVITGLEFERLSSPSGPTKGEIIINGKEPKAIVFIHCVGSRDKSVGNEYCSRVCCMYTAKHAHLIKEKIPDAKITIFYMDMRAFGKGFEEFYDRVREEGIIYRRGNASEIYKKNGKLVVRAEDTLLGKPIEVEADLVVLATGIVSRKETKEVANLLKLSRSSDGFFLEAHPKLRPVDTATDGIYLAGCCQGPKDIPDTVAQAKGAASSAIIPMSQGKVKVEPITSTIDEDICSGCRVCEPLCTYSALLFDEGKKIMFVNDIICKGCGSCGAACPAGAISMNHFTNEQVLAQIEALISVHTDFTEATDFTD